MSPEGVGGGRSLFDILDRVLDKGIVIDAWAAVSVVGIELITLRARAVVASIDTHLRYAEPLITTSGARPAVGGAHGQHDAPLLPERLPSPFPFSEAEPLLGAGYVIRHSLLAGERAIVADAFDEALGHFERAETSAAVSPEPVEDATTASILAGQVRSLTRMVLDLAGRQRQWDILARACDLYLKAGEHEKAAELVQEPVSLTGLKRTLQLTERILESVPQDSYHAGWLAVRRAEALIDESGDFHGARIALDRALELGDKTGDIRLQARAIAHLTRLLCAEDRHAEAGTTGRVAINLSREADDSWSQVRLPGYMAHSLMALGEPGSALSLSVANILLSTRLKLPLFRLSSLVDLALIARLKGDWDLVELSMEQMDEFGTQRRVKDWLVAVERLDRGPLPEGFEGLRAAAETMQNADWEAQDHWAAPFLVGALAAAARDAPDPNYVAVAHKAALDLLARRPVHPRIMHSAHHALGFAAVAREDTAAARSLYAEIASRRRLADSSGGFSIDRLLGLLAGAIGDRRAAVEHFEDALAFCRKAGYRPEFARTCCDYAELLLGADTGSDRGNLAALLDEGAAMATECDLAPTLGKLDALRARLPAYRAARVRHPNGLTEREVEVLRLVAAGLSNAEIARKLGIAPDTAAKHVAHILSKIGAANRAEAASYAHTHGLIDPTER